MWPAREAELRRQIVDTCQRMNALGVNQGTSGNVSARLGSDGFLITPSGVAYDILSPDDVVHVAFEEGSAGAQPRWTARRGPSRRGGRWGRRRPSSEWRIHRDVLLARPDTSAVLHAHPIRATALSCHGKEIPPFHYMVAVAGGRDVPCAPYATFGSQALSGGAVAALADRDACLLAHHGILALGDDPEAALALAVEIETLAAMYLEALRLGEPPRLSDDEMTRVLEAFASYGR